MLYDLFENDLIKFVHNVHVLIKIVYWIVGFTEPELEFWRQIAKKWGGGCLLGENLQSKEKLNINSKLILLFMWLIREGSLGSVQNKDKKLSIST